MLRFNSKGLLVPNLNIRSTVDELQKEFVMGIPTSVRETLFDLFLAYSNEIKRLCGKEQIIQWVNGSFVTKIKHPKDIDLVTFIDFRIVEAKEEMFTHLKFPASISNYNVDAYIVKVYPENHLKYPLYLGDRMYWMDRFDKTRRNRAGNRHPKGFLEIVY